MPKLGHQQTEEHKQRLSAAGSRNSAAKYKTPRELVDYARKYTLEALLGIIEIANSDAPAAVRLRAWEIVIERGYGKAPQAILVGADSTLPEGVHAMPIIERILALRLAKEKQGSTIELENSGAVDVEDVIG